MFIKSICMCVYSFFTFNVNQIDDASKLEELIHFGYEQVNVDETVAFVRDQFI